MTVSGRYYYRFYLQDAQSSVWSLHVAAETETSDDAHPSVDQIIANAVAQCRQETSDSEYDMALWLHDWTLDQLEYDYNLNWCSAESGLTRHQGTCESYQRIYTKLLNAAGIANGRIEGNGHTWNAVKIDGKWCQMDLTWDDTNDNWYGDLDQRHLYFGPTDELMAIAHSDHTANYKAEGYAYRSTDLSNDYFVRNGKADEWASAYVERIQQHLDAKEAILRRRRQRFLPAQHLGDTERDYCLRDESAGVEHDRRHRDAHGDVERHDGLELRVVGEVRLHSRIPSSTKTR